MSEPIKLVQSYMDSFFGLAPLELMAPLFADDLEFEGPFHKSSTATEYLDSLRKNPPEDVSYKLEETYENGSSVCLVYLFSKPGVETRMVQTFKISNGKISKIKLVFDTNAFT